MQEMREQPATDSQEEVERLFEFFYSANLRFAGFESKLQTVRKNQNLDYAQKYFISGNFSRAEVKNIGRYSLREISRADS